MARSKILFVFGTRPELIKMLPLMTGARRNPELDAVLCSTGQHRDMLEGLYSFFGLQPDVDLALMKPNQTLADLHATIMTKLEVLLREQAPDCVVVQGDTTTAQAAAMAAFYARVPVAHIEAGLRTYDIDSPFPEEMNRRVITLLSRLHFCPTHEAAANLYREKPDASSEVIVTGNTGIDTLMIAAEKIRADRDLQDQLRARFEYLGEKKFILMTMHRRENFGPAQREILKSCLELARSRPVNILFPMHPNPAVRQAVREVFAAEMGQTVVAPDTDPGCSRPVTGDRGVSGKIFLTEPLDYPSMVYIMERCEFLMTDSGGLQEEAPSFGKKLMVLRTSTERPEGISAGFSTLVGTDSAKILATAHAWLDQSRLWSGPIPENPYGDEKASERILQKLRQFCAQSFLSGAADAAGRTGDHDKPTLR